LREHEARTASFARGRDLVAIQPLKDARVIQLLAQPPKRRRRSPEEDICIAFMTLIFAAQAHRPELNLLYHVPNGGKRTRAQAGRFKAMGVRAGIPDYHLPVRRGGYLGLWIEMKAGKNGTSDSQTVMGAHLRREGHCVLICYSAEAAYQNVLAYLALGNEVRVAETTLGAGDIR
jgi:hypothetical protein